MFLQKKQVEDFVAHTFFMKAKEPLINTHIQADKKVDGDCNILKFFGLLYMVDKRNQKEKREAFLIKKDESLTCERSN